MAETKIIRRKISPFNSYILNLMSVPLMTGNPIINTNEDVLIHRLMPGLGSMFLTQLNLNAV